MAPREIPTISIEVAQVVEALRSSFMPHDPQSWTLMGAASALERHGISAPADPSMLEDLLHLGVKAGLLKETNQVSGYYGTVVQLEVRHPYIWPDYMTQDEPVSDPVHQPAHYTSTRFGELECIDITRWMTFNAGNAFKYVYRHAEKNGRQDLEKALVYLAWAEQDGDPAFWSEEGAMKADALFVTHIKPVLLACTEPAVYAALSSIVRASYKRATIITTNGIEAL